MEKIKEVIGPHGSVRIRILVDLLTSLFHDLERREIKFFRRIWSSIINATHSRGNAKCIKDIPFTAGPSTRSGSFLASFLSPQGILSEKYQIFCTQNHAQIRSLIGFSVWELNDSGWAVIAEPKFQLCLNYKGNFVIFFSGWPFSDFSATAYRFAV